MSMLSTPNRYYYCTTGVAQTTSTITGGLREWADSHTLLENYYGT